MKKRAFCIILFVVFILSINSPMLDKINVFSVKTYAAVKPSLSKKKLKLCVGKTSTLKLKNKGNLKVKWSSSNKSVATVNSKGKVVSLKSGTTTITAKAGKKKYKCKVTVPKMTIDKTVLALESGSYYLLKVKNAYNVKWSSDNSNVVSVDPGGWVTARSTTGTATITAKSKNETVTCVVSVYPKQVSYIGNRGLQTDTTNNCYYLYYTLSDSNEIPMKARGTVDVVIRGKNTNEVVFNKTISFSEKDFVNWGNNRDGYKLTCVLTIKMSDISKGKDDEGTISYTVKGDSYEFKTYTNSIDHLPRLTVTKIELDKTSVSMKEQEKITLTAKALPDGAINNSIKWKSLNPDIASVGEYSGEVTAKKEGETKIVAYTENNTSAECTITVEPVVTLDFPTFPITRSNYDYKNSIEQTYTVTSSRIEYSHKIDNYIYKIYFSGQKDYDYRGATQSASVAISWKIYDEDDVVVDSGTVYSPSIAMDEKFADANGYIKFPKPGHYRIVIGNTN